MLHNALDLSWKVLVVRGAVGVVFGIAAMVWPLNTALALAMLWGFWALADSVGHFAMAFAKDLGTGARAMLVISGLVALVAAFFAIFSPAVAAATLTWILGIWLIARGIFELLAIFSAAGTAARVLLVLSGGLDIALGVLFVANPGRSVVGLAFVLGLIALAWGLAFLAIGFVIRSQTRDLAATAGAPEVPAYPVTDSPA